MNTHILWLAPALVLCRIPALAQPAESHHSERITSSAHTWHVQTGGDLDMDNTATRFHGDWQIVFQNNIALEIANVGDVPVENPRVVANDRGRFRTWQAMLKEFTEGAASDQERIYLIWEGLRQHRHHDYPLYSDDEYHDPVRFLNIYGGGFCDDSGMVGSALYRVAGFDKELPFVRALHGHMMCEVWHDGDYQFMDIDQDTFYLDWYNQKPVSGDTVARDHYLAIREQAYGPEFQPWDNGPVRAAALFGRDDTHSGRGVVGHVMNYTLRPQERIVFRWDNRGKYPWQRENVAHHFFGNSQLIYHLRPEHAGVMPGTSANGFEVEDDELVATTFSPRLVIAVNSPYTVAGATLHFAWEDPTGGGIMRVEAAVNGGDYIPVRTVETNGGAEEEQIALDDVLGVAGGPPCRAYSLRIAGLDLIALRLRDIALETDLYAYPIALPRLRAGENTLEYSDNTEAPHAVEVRWQWREAAAEQGIPPPPAAPETPAHAATVRGTTVPFQWPAVEGVERYWLRVSRAPHMRYPYRPNYDVYVSTNTYEVPFPGMFNHGETYYWQVRPQRQGVWGTWSPRWEFTWEGPMPPVAVAVERVGEDYYLTWQPNLGAPPPAQYHVHANDVRGAVPGSVPALTVPGGTTRLRVARGDGVYEEGLYAAYYRVSAADGAGAVSGPSPQARLPRPLVYNLPAQPLRAGAPFDIVLRVVVSPGDMQFRYDVPPPQVETPVAGLGWWEAEAPEITLLNGPDWLHLVPFNPADPATGAERYKLTGTVPADGAGEHTFTLHTVLTHPNEVPPDAQGAEDFRRYLDELPERTQSFTLHVE